MTDPIADMLTRIRNAQSSHIVELVMPHSKIKQAIAIILQKEGYIKSSKVVKNGAFSNLQITLLTSDSISSLKRISKPGRRIYAKANEIPTVLGGRGLIIISTPQGIMSGVEARKAGLGGEIICEVS